MIRHWMPEGENAIGSALGDQPLLGDLPLEKARSIVDDGADSVVELNCPTPL